MVTALGRIGAAADVAVPGLVVALRNENQDVRAATCEALGRIGLRSRPVVEGLAQLAKSDPVEFVRLAAGNAEMTLRPATDGASVFGDRSQLNQRPLAKGKP